MTPLFETETERTDLDRALRPIDEKIGNLNEIEKERDRYYNEWKDAEARIREVRSSIFWWVCKTSMTISRILGRPSTARVPDSLVEAIEAKPPENKRRLKRPFPPQSQSAPPSRSEFEIDLEARLEKALFERGGYHGEWCHAENRLQEIQSSELWLRWRTFRNIEARFRLFRSLFKVIGEGHNAICDQFFLVLLLAGRFPGTVFTVAWSAFTAVHSYLRRPAQSDFEPTVSVSDDAVFRPRVLIVSPYYLHPPNHGSAVRLVNLVRELAESCDIYLLIFSSRGENPEERAALEPHCYRIDYHRWIPRLQPDWFGLRPAVAEVFRSNRATTKIRDIVIAHDIDIVQLEHAELGQYCDAVPAGIPIVLSEIDIAFRTHRRRRSLGFHTRFHEAGIPHTTTVDILRLFRYEIRNCRRADQIHTMSEVDAKYLARYLGDGTSRIRIVPNGVNPRRFRAPKADAKRSGVLFLGNFDHLPNVDALEFLINDVWPLLRLTVPDARLSIVGANPSERVRQLADCPGVVLEGEVPDPRPYYHGHRVMVAPIRAGSGTRLKILESFAAGIPVVSTTLGAEGIEAEDGRHLLLADRAMDFAAAIERLLTDNSLQTSIATAAAQLVRDNYDWEFVADRVRRNYLELIPLEKRQMRSASEETDGRHQEQEKGFQQSTRPDVSIVIPTYNGGPDLDRCLAAVNNQKTEFGFEIICVDSGSASGDIELMHKYGARVFAIDQRDFNHGLTRDFGASRARGDFLVFLSQDTVPVRDDWLRQIIEPLRRDASGKLAAVQGGSTEVIDPGRRFFWGSAGPRFYFTRESDRWIDRYGGIGFSTANCAIRRIIWDRYRFGWAPILEDKKWQREIVDAGYKIASLQDVRVFHSHAYGFKSLVGRCASEGYGWRLLGEHYRMIDAVSDILTLSVWRELCCGLQQKEARSSAEIAFPLLRPIALWWGNRFLRHVLR